MKQKRKKKDSRGGGRINENGRELKREDKDDLESIKKINQIKSIVVQCNAVL